MTNGEAKLEEQVIKLMAQMQQIEIRQAAYEEWKASQTELTAMQFDMLKDIGETCKDLDSKVDKLNMQSKINWTAVITSLASSGGVLYLVIQALLGGN